MSHKDAAFIYRGFRNWKDGTISISRHNCHKGAVQSMKVHPQQLKDIGEQLSEIHSHDETAAIKNSPKIPVLPIYCSKR